jgi:hypothetical protein
MSRLYDNRSSSSKKNSNNNSIDNKKYIKKLKQSYSKEE